MITVGSILDVYLNVNILLIAAFGIWVGTCAAMRATGIAGDKALALKLLKMMVLSCFLFPLMVFVYDQVMRPHGAEHALSLSLSDLMVSQYLRGSLDIKAAELDLLLGLRARLTDEFLALQSVFALVTAGLLGLGLLIGLGRLGISLYRLHVVLNKSYAWRRFGNVHLILSEMVTTPFSTRSLFRRYIVVPVEMLGRGKDLRMALGHEFQHLRQHDTEWELVLEFLRPLFFWNPAFHLLKRDIERLRELSCDQQVISRKDVNIRDYCECLLRTCEMGLRRREQTLRARPSVAFVQLDLSITGKPSSAFLEQRMLTLFEAGNARRNRALFTAILIPVLALVGLVAVMMQKPNDWSHERIMFSTVINLDRLAARNH